MPKSALLSSLAGTVLLLRISSACAQGFEVRPITIDTAGGVAQVVVSNPGERRVYLESHVLEWTQDTAGREQLTESDIAVASPPAFWVQPHASYTMRVKLPAPAEREQAFRVVLKQLPERADLAQGRIVFALTQNLPAFVAAATAGPPSVSARLLDPTHLLLENRGGRRLRVTGVTQGGVSLGSGLLGYALSQGALLVALPRPARHGPIELETDLGTRTVALR